MAYKIKTEDTSHWYSREGESCHVVLKAKKRKADPDEFRNTTLRDARKMNLLPSVSGYLDLIANEGLNRWKLGQVAIAATQMERQDGEDDETFADRIIEQSLSYTRGAADFGTNFHSAIEHYLINGLTPDQMDPVDPRVLEFWDPVHRWIDENIDSVVASEYVVVSRAGYAGRVDLKVILKGMAAAEVAMANPSFNGRCILDFKTRNPSASGELVSHDKELWQLAAYSAADPDTHDGGSLLPVANFYVGSKEPGQLKFLAYRHDEIEKAVRFFGHIVSAWSIAKNYDASF